MIKKHQIKTENPCVGSSILPLATIIKQWVSWYTN